MDHEIQDTKTRQVNGFDPCLLEEWKTLAESDRNDDIWVTRKENFLLVSAIAAFGLATKFCASVPPQISLVLYTGVAGLALLIANFVACERISNHQFARRMRLMEIEKELPIKFYTKQRSIMEDVRNKLELHIDTPKGWIVKITIPIYKAAMKISLRNLRLGFTIAGIIYFIFLLITAFNK